jgi:endonuclease/exonuclease/phosphatase family metal-dependent hydrolase
VEKSRQVTCFETDFDSRMGRTLLSVKIDETLLVSTAHLESLGNAALRRKQLAIARKFGAVLETENHFICGDFNFGDTHENGHIAEEYLDLWKALHPDELTLTWNPDENPTIRLSNPNDNWFSRCDRMILKSSQWKCETIKLIGTQLTVVHQEGKCCPSDHYGLKCSLQKEK